MAIGVEYMFDRTQKNPGLVIELEKYMKLWLLHCIVIGHCYIHH